ncbi:MAG: hypothetical protein V3S37_06945 [Dehalococcoidia bacterium]
MKHEGTPHPCNLPARATDVTQYEFLAPPFPGEVNIEVELIFRRAFKSLAQQKGWDVPDILMEEARLEVR